MKDSTLILDYSLEISLLSNIRPLLKFSTIMEMIQYDKYSPDNLNYFNYGDYPQRQNTITNLVKSEKVKYIVINFNVIPPKMAPEFHFIWGEIGNFDPVFSEGGIWVYQKQADELAKLAHTIEPLSQPNFIKEEAVLKLRWPNSLLAPPLNMKIFCSPDLHWVYPENGVDFPFQLKINVDSIEAIVPPRGRSNLKGCQIEYNEIDFDRKGTMKSNTIVIN